MKKAQRLKYLQFPFEPNFNENLKASTETE